MSISSNKTPKVLLALEMANSAGRQQLIGILRFLSQTIQWDVRIVQPPTELTDETVSQAANENFDGIITALPCSDTACRRLSKSGIPVILLDIDYPLLPHEQTRVIRLDDKDIATKAADYFLSMGNFNEYAFVPATENPDWSLRREKEFRNTLRKNKHGLNVPSQNCLNDKPMFSRWLCALRKPAAVFCANDTCASRVLETCHTVDIDVPGHLSILGVDDDEYLCELTRPAISSIRPDFENEGFQAAQMLSQMICGNTRRHANAKILAVGITERTSTCRLSPAAALVSRGIKFIQLNAKRNITVSAVVAHLGVSRRLADLRFRQVENKSILEIITEHRLEAVKQQLLKTNASIATITRSCGFSSPGYLKELFRRHCGKTMHDYRKRR